MRIYLQLCKPTEKDIYNIKESKDQDQTQAYKR